MKQSRISNKHLVFCNKILRHALLVTPNLSLMSRNEDVLARVQIVIKTHLRRGILGLPLKQVLNKSKCGPSLFTITSTVSLDILKLILNMSSGYSSTYIKLYLINN